MAYHNDVMAITIDSIRYDARAGDARRSSAVVVTNNLATESVGGGPLGFARRPQTQHVAPNTTLHCEQLEAGAATTCSLHARPARGDSPLATGANESGGSLVRRGGESLQAAGDTTRAGGCPGACAARPTRR